jgi:hypothetical protein
MEKQADVEMQGSDDSYDGESDDIWALVAYRAEKENMVAVSEARALVCEALATGAVLSSSDLGDFLGREHRHVELSEEEIDRVVDLLVREGHVWADTYGPEHVRANAESYLRAVRAKGLVSVLEQQAIEQARFVREGKRRIVRYVDTPFPLNDEGCFVLPL